MKFLEVKNLVIENLLEMYSTENNLKSEDDLINLFKKYYLLDYDTFLNQLIFEIYYETYIEKFKNKDKIYSVRKVGEKISHRDLNEAEEKKLVRTHNKFRGYQDKISLMLNKGKDIQLKSLKGGTDNLNGQVVYEWQVNQLKNLADEYGIFNEIVKGTLGDSDRLPGKDLVAYLKEYEKLYDEIEKQEQTYFLKSIQYYQLEIGNRIETFYKLASKLEVNIKSEKNIDKINQDNKFIWKTKQDLIESMKCLQIAQHFQDDSRKPLQNKFITGIEVYMDYQINLFQTQELNLLGRVESELFILNNNKYIMRKYILKYLKEKNIDLDYNDCMLEIMCKNFFGKKQHVYNEKDYSNTIIKNFRRAYR